MLKKNKQTPKRLEPLSSENQICRRTLHLKVVESLPTPRRENKSARPLIVAQRWDNGTVAVHLVDIHGLTVNVPPYGFNASKACRKVSDYLFDFTCNDLTSLTSDSCSENNPYASFTEKSIDGNLVFYAVENIANRVDSEDEDEGEDEDYDEDEDDEEYDDDYEEDEDDYEKDEDDDDDDYEEDDDYDYDEEDDDFNEESEIVEIEDYEYYEEEEDDDDYEDESVVGENTSL